MEGLELVFVHGTWASRTDAKLHTMSVADYGGGSTWNQEFAEKIASLSHWSKAKTYEFQWSGENSKHARRVAGRNLAKNLMDPKINPDAANKHATLVGHSHGGNVNKIAKKKLERNGWTVDVVNISTPQRGDIQSPRIRRGGVYINFYSEADLVQWLGSSWSGPLGSREDPAAKNYEIIPESYENSIEWFNSTLGHSIHNEKSGQELMLPIIERAFKTEYGYRTPSFEIGDAEVDETYQPSYETQDSMNPNNFAPAYLPDLSTFSVIPQP